MAKGQVIVMSLLGILGIAAIGGGLYLGTYVEDQLQQGIEDLLVIDPDFPTDDPEGYADWLTNEDPDDTPKYRKYYFMNLTNPDAYLTGATPIMDEIGPYAYRQYDVRITDSVVITETTVKFNTFTYFVFDADESFAGANPETDKIVNINPQYLGVLAADPFFGSEAAFVTAFVGPAIEQIMDGLTTDFVFNVQVQGGADAAEQVIDGLTGDFASGVIFQGMPLVLEAVQAGVTENLHLAINGTTAAKLVGGNLQAAASQDPVNYFADFFNSTSFYATYAATISGAMVVPLQGISENATVDLGYTALAADTLLNQGVPGIGVPLGWLDDLDTGTGVLYFMGAYQVAADVGDTSLTLAQMAAAYNMTEPQLNQVANYVVNHLFEDNVQTAVTATYGAGTATVANLAFYQQWANTSFTDPLDLDSDMSADGFEVFDNSSISMTDAMTLWDDASPYSLTNDGGIQLWIGALLQDGAALTALGTQFPVIFGNATVTGLLLNWINNFKEGFVTDQVLLELSTNLGVSLTAPSDIGIYHWANGAITSGLSIEDFGEPFSVEYWNITASTLDYANAKELLETGTTLADDAGLGAIYTYGATAATNATALGIINAVLETSLSGVQAATLYGYVDGFLIDALVIGELALAHGVSSWTDVGYFHWGNSSITEGLSVYEIDPSGLPGIPEFWKIGNMNLSLANSLALLTGAANLTDSTYVGLALLPTTTTAVFNGVMGSSLSDAEFGALKLYLGHLMQTFVVNYVLAPIFALGGGLITARTADQWLYDYTDPLLGFLAANLDPTIDPAGEFFTVYDSEDDVPESDADTFMTGGDDIDNVGQFVLWNSLSAIPGVWGQTELIEGTDATQFAPGVESSDTLRAFVSDLLRVVDLVYEEDVEVEGIDLLRFVLSEATLAVNANYHQSVVGLANMTAAIGAPLFLSKPHFLDADASATSSLISGLSADAELHDTFIDVEPLTGVTMSARKRLQLNFFVAQNDLIYTGQSSAYMPVLWVEEGADITADQANDFKETVYGAQRLQQTAQIAGPAIGALLLLSAMVMGVRMRKP